MLPHRRTSVCLAVASALLCLGITQYTQAQAQTPASDTLYHVHGTVTDGVTGKPIARALVNSNDQRLATLTDRDGHFTLDISVPPAPAQFANAEFRTTLSLQTRKPGYFQKTIPSPINLEAATSPLELKLMPAAGISGRVSASHSDAPENVRITLLRRQVQDGLYIWQQSGSQLTDSRGEFHFTNLEAGQYTLLSTTWRENATATPRQPTHREPGQPPAPIEQYPAVYNGDVPTLAAATLLHLRFGQTTTAELHLHPAMFYPVALPVTLPSPTTSVNVTFAGGDSYKGLNLRYNEQGHNVTGFLPNGSYTLLLTGFDRSAANANNNPATNQRSFASVPLTVSDASVQAASVALAPSPSIEVRVQTQFTQNDSGQGGSFSGGLQVLSNGKQQARPPINLYLRPIDPGVNFGGNQQHPTSATTLLLEDLQPGRYTAMAQPYQGYVASITSGGVDLLSHPLVVHSGSMPPIDVLLLDNTATITGSLEGVAPSSAPQTGAYSVFLFATDGSGRQVQGFQQQQGKYMAYNVPPGTYRAFAIYSFGGQPPPIPFREPDGLRMLEGKGKTVTVAAGQSLQVDLPLLETSSLMGDAEDQ